MTAPDNDNKAGAPISRRTLLKYGGALGAGAVAAPGILMRSAHGQDKNKIVFISEESNPRAIKVYEKINADFKAETGIEVVMEYPGFANIAKRVATLIAAGTPAEIVWYGAGQAMELALQDQLADVGDVIRDVGGIPDNLRFVYQGADRSIPTSQQFVYGWYRSDKYEEHGLEPIMTWEHYLQVAETLNNPPTMYGAVVPSAHTGPAHLLIETMFRTNDVHWFRYNESKGAYEVHLDQGDNKKRAVETLEFLNALHQFSPEASNYGYGDLINSFVSEKTANAYYVGARLLIQVIDNNRRIEDVTKPVRLPPRLADKYYLSIQGFHVNKNANVDAAKQYCKFFMQHPDYIEWLHSVPLHITPAQREILHSEKYQDNDIIQRHMDVLHFLDSIWGDGVPDYYWDGPKLNPLTGLYSNDNLGGWMIAARNIQGLEASEVVDRAADQIRRKMKRMS